MPNPYVQFGCGLCAPKSWRNFDVSPTLRLQKVPLLGQLSSRFLVRFPANVEYGDIVRGLPLQPQSCKAIYCSHVLEHLALDDFRLAIKNVYSYLETDGVFRFVLPDLEILARNYLSSEDADASLAFMRHSRLGEETRPRGFSRFVRHWLGNSAHLWMWDFRSLSSELENVGFRNVRRATCGDSQEPRFDEVEDPSRWESCLGMECVR